MGDPLAMTYDLIVSLGMSAVFTVGGWLVARWIRQLTVPLSPEQERRRPVIERWFFGFTFVGCFFAVLWGLRG